MRKTQITFTLILFAIFLAYTCMCIMVDVSWFSPINAYSGEATYGQAEVGFYSININVRNAIDFNETFYKLSEYLGYLALLTGAAIGCLWLYRLIKTRNLMAVEPILNASVVTLALMVAFYVLFEAVDLNYRPVVLKDGLEPSYPSSHTLLGLVVFGCAAMVCKSLTRDKGLGKSLCFMFWLLGTLVMLFRALSGVHWLSDIVGGILLSAALLYLNLYLAEAQEKLK